MNAEEALKEIRALVNEQAEDALLWLPGLTENVSIEEAYVRQELRKLHSLIEKHTNG